MVMTTVDTTQSIYIGFKAGNVGGCCSLGAQVIYFSGDSNKQENGKCINQSFMNSTAYKLPPTTYYFFSQKASHDEAVASQTKQKTVITDVHEQFNDLHRFFQFRKTEWAQVFGVSRVSIYGWLNKTMEPSGANKKRIEQLYQILCEIPDRSFEDTVHLYVHHHIAKLNASLFEVITSSQALMDQRSSIIQVLEELIDSSRKKRLELDRMLAIKKASEATLDYNLDQLFS
jgi:hypothetical protein